MDYDKTGGPVYPGAPMGFMVDAHGNKTPIGGEGMTLRDYFAGQALDAYIARFNGVSEDALNNIAHRSYAMADAMIAARDAQ